MKIINMGAIFITAILFCCVLPCADFVCLAEEMKPEADTAAPQDDTASQSAPEESKDGAIAPVLQEEPKDSALAPEIQESLEPAENAAPQVETGNVTVNFKGADIKTVLAYIAEVSGIDIVPAPDVKGIVDLKLTNKPWKVALDIIVRNYGFAYERDGDIIRVVTIDKLKQEELMTQAFNLNYGSAKEVAASIKDVVGERGKVIADERTNIVLVTDIPTSLYKISEVITKLDKKTAQVLIEARIIETTLDDTEKLGIDWNVKFSASGAKRPTTLPFEQWTVPFGGKKGVTNNFFPQVLTSSPTTAVSTAGGGSSTTAAADFPLQQGGVFAFPFVSKDSFTFGTLDFSEFSMVLEMIKARSDTDIISNPRIATLNNSAALINVGNTLNLPKYERNSTTGKMEITGYDAKDLGIILKVTPHINDKDEIVVDVAPEISDLLRYDTLDAASGIVAPVFTSRQAKTQVMIRDGDTIFIGGLIKENNVNTRKKLPFLGDLLGDVPYVGLLFTKKDVIKKKTELIFFITVNLMKDDRAIPNAPVADKAHKPKFTVTQEEDPGIKKKNMKRQ